MHLQKGVSIKTLNLAGRGGQSDDRIEQSDDICHSLSFYTRINSFFSISLDGQLIKKVGKEGRRLRQSLIDEP